MLALLNFANVPLPLITTAFSIAIPSDLTSQAPCSRDVLFFSFLRAVPCLHVAEGGV